MRESANDRGASGSRRLRVESLELAIESTCFLGRPTEGGHSARGLRSCPRDRLSIFSRDQRGNFIEALLESTRYVRERGGTLRCRCRLRHLAHAPGGFDRCLDRCRIGN